MKSFNGFHIWLTSLGWEFACFTPCFRYFLPQTKDMCRKLIGISKLTVVYELVCECVCNCAM